GIAPAVASAGVGRRAGDHRPEDVRVHQAADVLGVARLLVRRGVRKCMGEDLADDLAHPVDDALHGAVVEVVADLRGLERRRQAELVQQALRFLGLADQLGDLAGVAGSRVQAGGEEIADRPLPEDAEQGRFPGVATANAANVNLRHVFSCRQVYFRTWPHLALRAAGALVRGLCLNRRGTLAGTRRANVRNEEDGPATAPTRLARHGT